MGERSPSQAVDVAQALEELALWNLWPLGTVEIYRTADGATVVSATGAPASFDDLIVSAPSLTAAVTSWAVQHRRRVQDAVRCAFCGRDSRAVVCQKIAVCALESECFVRASHSLREVP